MRDRRIEENSVDNGRKTEILNFTLHQCYKNECIYLFACVVWVKEPRLITQAYYSSLDADDDFCFRLLKACQ